MATLDTRLEPLPAKPYKAPMIAPGHTPGTVTEHIASIPLTPIQKTPKWWLGGFAVAFLVLMVFLWSVGNLLVRGVGIWGINQPVGWGFDIINFVWWIGMSGIEAMCSVTVPGVWPGAIIGAL